MFSKGVRVPVNDGFFLSLFFILHRVILYLLYLYIYFNHICTIIHPLMPSIP